MARAEPSGAPVDWEARQKALCDLRTSFAVEAGAGTGKTTLLVGRILNLVRAGVARLEEIVAITFTEKAAGELKQRLREELERALAAADADERAGTELDPERRRLAEALLEIDRAPISTIHSFAGTLLRERPIEAGIDPFFEQLDEIGMELLFHEVWSDWLEGEMQVNRRSDAAPGGTLRRALLAGVTLTQIEELARRLYDERDLSPPPGPADPATAVREFCERFHRDVEELAQLAERACLNREDNGFRHIQELRRQSEMLGQAAGEKLEPAFLSLKVKKNKGSQKNWRSKEACKEQKEICAALAIDLAELQGRVKADVSARLVEWLGDFVGRVEQTKRERGLLDFPDLLLLARNLLRENKAVRRYFQLRYRVLLVDEFQDTDPLQAEIVFFLAEDGTAPAADEWRDVRVAPGKLFLVGDPKQSIYRFRRADMELYRLAREQLVASGGEALAIVENFRTVPGVIGWVNRLFEPLTEQEDVRPHQPAYLPLAAHRPPVRDEARAARAVVTLVPDGKIDLSEAKSDEVRYAEAEAIAGYIREQVRAGTTVYDKRLGSERPLTYRDIALLFPKRTAVDTYEERFKAADIPFRMEGGKAFYRRREVHEMLDALAAIDDPLDEVAVVSALRSCFGVDDAELYAHYRAAQQAEVRNASGGGGRGVDGAGRGSDGPGEGGDGAPIGRSPWDYRARGGRGGDGNSAGGDGSHAVADAFGQLAALHAARARIAPSRLIERVLERTRLLELYYLQPHGEQAVANLYKLVDDARTLERRGFWTLRSVVGRLREMEGGGRDEAESPIAEEDDDSVRFITMHAAKGLEFPVAILADLNGQRNRTENFIVDRAAGTFAFKIGSEQDGFQTAGYADASEIEQRRMKAEDQRLLYVAATRARDQLVVPVFAGERTDGFMLMLESVEGALSGQGVARRAADEWISGARDVPAFRPSLDAPVTPADTRPETGGARPGDCFIRARETWRAERAALLARASRVPAVAAAGEWGRREEGRVGGGVEEGVDAGRNDLGRVEGAGDGHRTFESDGLPGAAALGEAVHRALERAPLHLGAGRTDDVARALAAEACGEHCVLDRADEAAEMVARVLRSPLWGRAGRAARCAREVPFTVPLDGELVEGVIDLVIDEADGLTVVDYKTDRVREEALEARFLSNRGQGIVYARALEAVTGRPVNAVHFLFARTGEVRALQRDETEHWGRRRLGERSR